MCVKKTWDTQKQKNSMSWKMDNEMSHKSVTKMGDEMSHKCVTKFHENKSIHLYILIYSSFVHQFQNIWIVYSMAVRWVEGILRNFLKMS